jgi:hypothetical protein
MCPPDSFTLRKQPSRSWDVEVSADRVSWQQVEDKEDKEGMDNTCFTGISAGVDNGDDRFIWRVKIGKNQGNDDTVCFSASRIFGSLIE